MKWSDNVPLTHAEIKRLPLGRTDTSFGSTGQQNKKDSRLTYDRTNRKPTRGRLVQYIPIVITDSDGKVIVRKTRPVWHKKTRH